MKPFAANAIEALLNQGEVAWFARRRPDWWRYIQDSIVLARLGANAAELFDMDVHSDAWKSAQYSLNLLWLKIEHERGLSAAKALSG